MGKLIDDLVEWLWAIETASNDAGERGDFEAQEFYTTWWHAVRDGAYADLSPYRTFGT